MKEIEEKYHQNDKHYDLTFVADLNGLKLENYISNYLNSTIEVINGRINVELEQIVENKSEIIRKNYTLNVSILDFRLYTNRNGNRLFILF
jgi:hypothetical protein